MFYWSATTNESAKLDENLNIFWLNNFFLSLLCLKWSFEIDFGKLEVHCNTKTKFCRLSVTQMIIGVLCIGSGIPLINLYYYDGFISYFSPYSGIISGAYVSIEAKISECCFNTDSELLIFCLWRLIECWGSSVHVVT